MISFSNVFDPSSADTSAGLLFSFDVNGDGDFDDPEDVLDSSDSWLELTGLDAGVYEILARVEDKDGGYTEYWTTLTVEEV